MLRQLVSSLQAHFKVHKMAVQTPNEISGADLDIILDMLEDDFFDGDEDLQIEFEKVRDEVSSSYVLLCFQLENY